MVDPMATPRQEADASDPATPTLLGTDVGDAPTETGIDGGGDRSEHEGPVGEAPSVTDRTVVAVPDTITDS